MAVKLSLICTLLPTTAAFEETLKSFLKFASDAWRYDPSASLRPNGKSLRHFTEKDGLSSKHISVIYRDKRGDLWLGGEGVFKFNRKLFDRVH